MHQSMVNRYQIMKALKGILVVTIEQALTASLGSYRQADAGARVIKIARGIGDFSCGYDSVAHDLTPTMPVLPIDPHGTR